jgi:hypothetical protein
VDVVRLDRDTVRRVLRRAVELEGAEARRLPDADGIDADTLVAAAAEVGIPEHAVRRSLALERLGPPPADGGHVLGAAVVVIEDELHGDAGDVLARLDAWFVSGHHLRRDRLRDGRGTWTRRRGVVGSTFRSLRHITGEGYLGDLQRIDVVALDSGTGTCVVRIAADRRRERRVRSATGVVVATATTAGAVVGAAALGPLLLLVAPVTVAAGAGIAMSGRGRAKRVAGEIDRVLDDVEHGARPVRLVPDLARRVVGRPGRIG